MTTRKKAGVSEERVLDDEAIERMRQERFGRRVQRVLEVMKEERVDWRGVPFIAPDGRIGVRVMPVDAANAARE